MTTPKENRTYGRFPHRATLICSPFNTTIYYNTQKCNHGGGGLCFESDHAFPRGTILNIRMKDYSTNGLGPESWDGFRMMSIGEVKWCRKIHDAKGSHFDVGVKYYDPVY